MEDLTTAVNYSSRYWIHVERGAGNSALNVTSGEKSEFQQMIEEEQGAEKKKKVKGVVIRYEGDI